MHYENSKNQNAAYDTRLTQRYGVRHPFACAGLAFAGMTPDLAIAVCKGGGIGALGVGFMPPEELRAKIRAIRAATDAPFNVNFIHSEGLFFNDEQVKVCAEEGVPVVSFHWGHPSKENIRILRDAGVSFWEQVGDVDAAKRAVDDGAEVVIAQGWEAGGHNYGGLPTMVLLPQVVDAVGNDSMVLGAGGIADGRGVAAALSLGADGVWVGTRMVATHEAYVHEEHKQRLVEADGTDTVRSGIFGPDFPEFNPMRLLRNRVVEAYTDRLESVPTTRSELDKLNVIGTTDFHGNKLTLHKFSVLLPTPEMSADWEEVPFLSGQGVGLIHSIAPASEVVESMMNEAYSVLGRIAARRNNVR